MVNIFVQFEAQNMQYPFIIMADLHIYTIVQTKVYTPFLSIFCDGPQKSLL